MRTLATVHGGPTETYRLHTVTFASANKYLVHLALSVQRAGGFLNVLGTLVDKQPLPADIGLDTQGLEGYLGFGRVEAETDYRLVLFKRLWWMRALAAKLPPDDLLLYIDGHDVLFQGNIASVLHGYERLVSSEPKGLEGGPVIFMGLPDCRGRFAGRRAALRYPLGKVGADRSGPRTVLGAQACSQWRKVQRKGLMPFVDTGGYIGRASSVLAVLDEAIAIARTGIDLICMTLLHIVGLDRPDLVKVDTEANIFYAVRPLFPNEVEGNFTPHFARPLCGPNHFDALSGEPPAHVITGTTPAIVHFVGHAKWYHLTRCIKAFARQHLHELVALRSSQVLTPSRSVGLAVVPACARPPNYDDCFGIPPEGFGFMDVDKDEVVMRSGVESILLDA